MKLTRGVQRCSNHPHPTTHWHCSKARSLLRHCMAEPRIAKAPSHCEKPRVLTHGVQQPVGIRWLGLCAMAPRQSVSDSAKQQAKGSSSWGPTCGWTSGRAVLQYLQECLSFEYSYTVYYYSVGCDLKHITAIQKNHPMKIILWKYNNITFSEGHFYWYSISWLVLVECFHATSILRCCMLSEEHKAKSRKKIPYTKFMGIRN